MYANKKCSKCGENATHKFTRIDASGNVHDIYLCAEHAGEMSPYQKQKNLSEILEGLLKQELGLKSSVSITPSATSGVKCAHCGLPYDEYKKTLLLGCSECYESFKEYLGMELRKFHGDSRHVGRGPGGEYFEADREPETTGSPFPVIEAESAEVVPMEEEKAAPKESKLDQLHRSLGQAIKSENYERAAEIRDEIHQLKAQKETDQ